MLDGDDQIQIPMINLQHQKTLRKHKIKLNFYGKRQSYDDILLAKSGRIDAMIIDAAKENNASLMTSDLLQANIAEIKGLEVKYFRPWKKSKRIKIDKFLTKDTMSVHLKEGATPYAKRGKPGKVKPGCQLPPGTLISTFPVTSLTAATDCEKRGKTRRKKNMMIVRAFLMITLLT